MDNSMDMALFVDITPCHLYDACVWEMDVMIGNMFDVMLIWIEVNKDRCFDWIVFVFFLFFFLSPVSIIGRITRLIVVLVCQVFTVKWVKKDCYGCFRASTMQKLICILPTPNAPVPTITALQRCIFCFSRHLMPTIELLRRMPLGHTFLLWTQKKCNRPTKFSCVMLSV